MTAKADLLEAAFHLNMSRISQLVQIIESHDSLKPTTLFGPSSGVRADILRSIVVFLHATFEVAIRSHIPRRGCGWSFYSGADLDKALTSSGIDGKPFRSLYPPLTQMAKRRNRIVHEADLVDGDHYEWNIADDWQLIIWLLAVPTFYYQLRISLHAANVVEQTMYDSLRAAMTSHHEWGKQLLALPTVPPELQIRALQESVATLKSIVATMHLDARDFVPNQG
jgi:hypothetical protein